MAKGFLGIDWWKFRDDVFFGGAEQKTNEDQYQREVKQYVEDYRGPMNCTIDSGRSGDSWGIGASCAKCGRSVSTNYAELPGKIYLCPSCVESKLENPDQESPWSWKRKPPVRLG